MNQILSEIANVSLAGILVLLILREVFGYLQRRNGNGNGIGRKRTPTGPPRPTTSSDQIIDRLDRIIDRLDELADATRAARKQTEINAEHHERVSRQLTALEATIAKIETCIRHRATGPLASQT
jgi:hypothetical protein